MKKSNSFRRILTVLLAMLLLAGSMPAALADSFKAKINSSSAKVYAKASTSSKSIKGKKGVTVTVTDYSGKWAKIKYKGNVGYMPIKYLNLTERVKLYTAKKSTSVYKKADSDSSRLGELPRGTAVYMIGMDGSYVRIQDKDGDVTGYIHSDNLWTYDEMKDAYEAYKQQQEADKKPVPTPKPDDGDVDADDGFGDSDEDFDDGFETPDDEGDIDSVIALARALIGRPYEGDANPPRSFNCSLFVAYCMENGGGYDMKDTAASQASDTRYAKISSVSSLRAGDVLFFDTDSDGKCDHSAIYLGGGDFIECSQNAGKVQINELDSWYKDCFMHARRPA